MTVGLLVLLGTGFGLVLDGPWSFDEIWVALGLAGYAGALAWGALVAEPEIRRVEATIRERGPDDPAVAAGGRRLLSCMWVELAIFSIVVLVMVAKPTAGSVGVWALAGGLLTCAGLLAAHGYRSAEPTAALAER